MQRNPLSLTAFFCVHLSGVHEENWGQGRTRKRPISGTGMGLPVCVSGRVLGEVHLCTGSV